MWLLDYDFSDFFYKIDVHFLLKLCFDQGYYEVFATPSSGHNTSYGLIENYFKYIAI
jgi:hypothetical protein